MFLSIIIPVYNLLEYLPRCVSSICEQSFTNWEMLLIDDGSTDGSEDLCDQFAASDPRIRVFHKPNGGVSSARNFGLRYASGDYILFVDSDDFLLPGALSCLRNVLQQHPRCDILQFGFQEGENTYCSAEDAFRTAEDFFLSGGMPLRTVWGSLFRKSIVDGIQFPDGIPVGEDTEFSTRCYFKANYIGVISRPLYHYRITAGSAIRSPFSPKKVRSILSVIHNLQDSIRPRNSAESRALALVLEQLRMSFFQTLYYAGAEQKKLLKEYYASGFAPVQRINSLRFAESFPRLYFMYLHYIRRIPK